jgi:hypothetical protein
VAEGGEEAHEAAGGKRLRLNVQMMRESKMGMNGKDEHAYFLTLFS